MNIGNRPDCIECPYSSVYTAQDGWKFVGCSHKPYNGKWVAEISNCPKNNKNIIF